MTPSSRRRLIAAVLLALPLCLVAQRLPASDRFQLHAQASRLDAARILGSIEPGKDIEPKISDPNRVATILKLIADVYYGRPLQFPKDGTVFSNKEGRLPAKPKGYYREYTVMPPKGSPASVTIGSKSFTIPAPPPGNRGAERLVIGGGELAYYSPDHYKTFFLLTIIR